MTITVITPTLKSRAHMLDNLASLIEHQTVQPDQWLIDDSGHDVGVKRNNLVSQATSDIIIHMDDDDIYLPTYIERAVMALQMSPHMLVGLCRFPMYDVSKNEVRMFHNNGYIAEATMCYYRDGFPLFGNVRSGEGLHILKAIHHNSYDSNDFLAVVHGRNTCSHMTLPLIKKLPQDVAASILERFYSGDYA